MLGSRVIFVALAAGLANSESRNIASGDIAVARFGQAWYGPDGPWSAVEVDLGTPRQKVYLTVATLQDIILPITPGACNNQQACIDGRGLAFNQSASSTWSPGSDRYVELSSRLVSGLPVDDQKYGVEIMGLPGSDSISIGGLSSISNVSIGAIKSTKMNNGILGLRNLTLEMFNQHRISSPSWGYYTGYGDGYRSPQLVFGGYDKSKYLAASRHNYSMELTSSGIPTMKLKLDNLFLDDTGRPDPATLGTGSKFIREPLDVVVDSSTPYCWLPRRITDSIARSVGAVWNESVGDSGYYIYNTSSQAYKNLEKATVAFHFDQAGEQWIFNSMTVSQSLWLRPPTNGVPLDGQLQYLPLMPVDSGNSYVLGRSFLQQVYLTADYHTMEFSISQIDLDSQAPAEYVTIRAPAPLPPATATAESSKNSVVTARRGLTEASIVGLVVGLVAALALVLGGYFWYTRLRRKSRRITMPVPPDPDKMYNKNGVFYRELSADSVVVAPARSYQPHPFYAPGSHGRVSFQSPVEMPADSRSLLERIRDRTSRMSSASRNSTLNPRI